MSEKVIVINEQDGAKDSLSSAESHFGIGDYRKALDSAKTALQLDSTNIKACIMAGRSATKLKRFEEAYDFYRDGLKIDPKNKIIAEELIDLQKILLNGFEKISLEATDQDFNMVHLCSQDVYPGDEQHFLLEKEILEKKCKVDCSLPNKTVNLNKKKESEHSLTNAHKNMLAGNTEDAIVQCTKALDADPFNVEARQLRAQLHQEKGNIELSLQDLWAIPKQNRTIDIWKFGGI